MGGSVSGAWSSVVEVTPFVSPDASGAEMTWVKASIFWSSVASCPPAFMDGVDHEDIEVVSPDAADGTGAALPCQRMPGRPSPPYLTTSFP